MTQPWWADYEGRGIVSGEIVRGSIGVGSDNMPAKIDEAFTLVRAVFIRKHPEAEMTRLVMYPNRDRQ